MRSIKIIFPTQEGHDSVLLCVNIGVGVLEKAEVRKEEKNKRVEVKHLETHSMSISFSLLIPWVQITH